MYQKQTITTVSYYKVIKIFTKIILHHHKKSSFNCRAIKAYLNNAPDKVKVKSY